jgi:hypothetical protein
MGNTDTWGIMGISLSSVKADATKHPPKPLIGHTEAADTPHIGPVVGRWVACDQPREAKLVHATHTQNRK